jgi:hydrogenase maturation protease
LKTLIFGYGNLDRQDDGVAWHVIVQLRKLLEISQPEEVDQDFSSDSDLVFVYQLQLTPEISSELVQFDRVCFIDAHAGTIPEDVQLRKLLPEFQHSPLTHHLTPESLLAITSAVYQHIPQTILVTIRGFEFQFTQNLSETTRSLVPQAANIILDWINRI